MLLFSDQRKKIIFSLWGLSFPNEFNVIVFCLLFSYTLVSISWQFESRRPTSLLGKSPKCHAMEAGNGACLQIVDASGLGRGPWRTGRQDAGPLKQGGDLVEAKVSCTWCWSVQLLPADREGGQCHSDSTSGSSVNNSTFGQSQPGSADSTSHLFAPCWEEPMAL